jgi:hypothetical protein
MALARSRTTASSTRRASRLRGNASRRMRGQLALDGTDAYSVGESSRPARWSRAESSGRLRRRAARPSVSSLRAPLAATELRRSRLTYVLTASTREPGSGNRARGNPGSAAKADETRARCRPNR